MKYYYDFDFGGNITETTDTDAIKEELRKLGIPSYPHVTGMIIDECGTVWFTEFWDTRLNRAEYLESGEWFTKVQNETYYPTEYFE